MYTHCGHDIGKWLKHRKPPAYSQRRTREIAILDRWSTYVAERKSTAGKAGEELRRTFSNLANQWRTETAHLSSITAKIAHPAYMRIIGLGPAAIPFVLSRLETEPAYWFAALRSLTGYDPVQPEDYGRFRAMREAWLEWGRNRGLI